MTDEELETKAKKRVEARMGFLIHAAIYVIASTGFIVTWALSTTTYPWFLWPVLGWGIGIVSHGLTVVFGPDSERGERAIEREVARLRAHH
jgi:hypothetical protein